MKSLRIILSKEKINLLLLELLVFLGLTITYHVVISPIFGYWGFSNEFNWVRFITGILMIIIISVAGKFIKDEFFFAIWNIILVYFFYGTIIFYQYNNNVDFRPAFSILLFLLILYIFSKVKLDFKVSGISMNSPFLVHFLIFLSILLLIPYVYYFHEIINWKNIFLLEIYETRLKYREVNENLNTNLLGYITAPLTRIVIPVIVVVSIKKRKYLLLFLGFCILIYVFLCGALKSIFIGFFAVLIFYQGAYSRKPFIFSYLLLALIFLGLSSYFLFNDVFIIDGFLRRVFFVPPLLDSVYYENFYNNYLYWSYSPFGNFFQNYPFDRELSFYVGEILIGRPGLNANIGIITEGYISFGYLGVLIHSIIFSFVLLYFKCLHIHPAFFGILFIYIYVINTSFLSVLFLTHGLLFLIIFSLLFLTNSYTNLYE